VDITERKRAEEALRESEERWHFISQATYEGIVVHEQGTIVDVSETGARMVGYTREELIGKSILIFIHPDSVETVLKNVSSGAESPIEAIGLRKDGTTFHCELRGRNLTFQDRPVRVVVVRDITERKQAEEQLAASEAELRALFAGMTDVVIVYDADGRYIKIAPTNPINLYRPPDDMLGKTVHDILPKEQADYTVAKIGEALQTGQVVTGEYALQIGGKERWFAGSVSRLSENTAVWVAHDITTRKRAEEQIQSQVETLGALYDLSRTLSEMEDFNAILDRVTRCAVESTHVTFARVLLLEQDDLVARAAFPVRVLDHALQVGQREPLADHPTCQRVLDENTPLVIQAGSPEAGDCASFFLGIAQTLCIIPLHVHEHPFGLLMLGEARDPAREPFTTEKLHLARSIGDQTISTFHRAALHEQTEKQVQRLAALREIDMAISSSFDLRVTLSIVLNQILMQLKVDAADVLLLNPFLQSLDDTVFVLGEDLGIAIGLFDFQDSIGGQIAGSSLLGREKIGGGLDIGTQPHLLGDLLADGLVVSGDHFHLDAVGLGIGDSCRRIHPGRVKQRQNPQKLPGAGGLGPSHPQGPVPFDRHVIDYLLSPDDAIRVHLTQVNDYLGSPLGYSESLLLRVLYGALGPLLHRIKGDELNQPV
ncbi:MAG: hypothetical protein COY47_01060, partial [Chloroflexi bacterium CG_4_10_14_0_8_um_filter_57_5]